MATSTPLKGKRSQSRMTQMGEVSSAAFHQVLDQLKCKGKIVGLLPSDAVRQANGPTKTD